MLTLNSVYRKISHLDGGHMRLKHNASQTSSQFTSSQHNESQTIRKSHWKDEGTHSL